ncbi:tRNA lysidine(34) synthetase TilS [Synoicihabitans lomoniglobus]|uniref:tRNA(Ile)-lysidine synthase n=1 Tax=Synoicihabitans lomoniglobus TaxID=2909285 RepID=A0AAF0CQS5_9BACT|nr:tRNA lysidine(34) synthetase TilS [Opitutaceae bacterium LMO-M01]WED66308.1 tRNA lysidine(34) synthetase TilS [Opitutaceae bacterium LMO-M01]
MAEPKLSRWQTMARRMAAAIPIERLHPAVVSAAASAGRRRWIVAVSGGSDSVALGLLVWAHWPQHRDRLVLAHFDHRLRGRASAEDARFCRRLAEGLGIDCEIGRWESPPAAASEAAARAARNGFFDEVRRRHRSRVIWTGHQRDDVAETLLMRLARGSGSRGLSAPRPLQDWGESGSRWRPLIGLSREELETALQAAGARWREDETNSGEAYFRTRVRQQVVPVWIAAAGRDAVAGAARSRELIAEDDAALECWLDELDVVAADGALSLTKLAGRPAAIWRRALHRWLGWQADGGGLSRQGFEVLLEKARSGKTSRFSLGTTGFARIRRGRLYFEKLSP